MPGGAGRPGSSVPGYSCQNSGATLFHGRRPYAGDGKSAFLPGSSLGRGVLPAVLRALHDAAGPDVWKQAGGLPETYFTAWGSLLEGLKLCEEDTLLVRGGTCSLGYAAIRLAKAMGCRVIATTHKESKLPLLKEADRAVLDTGRLAGSFSGVTKALELVGPGTLRDTLRCVKKNGIVCCTGILGGVYTLNDFDPIKEIPGGVYLTGFFSNYPDQRTMKDIFSFIGSHQMQPDIGALYRFDNISEALSDMDHHKVDGKIVVTV
ncbi:MAG TPA: zinc-binding dehydrogenase [Candidatus Scatomonas pullistercoris]|uniref:Zinc-binding dehydrogenase n=1 Tax=Candidatus Scatomonas pullistercoris TaxID=2840920 RepID=A0A9D1P2C9_9FIRM|nr:zinc-binding dehydrogenase [Candidatus Scatomonas pullistercoris]